MFWLKSVRGFLATGAYESWRQTPSSPPICEKCSASVISYIYLTCIYLQLRNKVGKRQNNSETLGDTVSALGQPGHTPALRALPSALLHSSPLPVPISESSVCKRRTCGWRQGRPVLKLEYWLESTAQLVPGGARRGRQIDAANLLRQAACAKRTHKRWAWDKSSAAHNFF